MAATFDRMPVFRVDESLGCAAGDSTRPPQSGTRVVAVAGIARPERFFRRSRQGWDVVRELVSATTTGTRQTTSIAFAAIAKDTGADRRRHDREGCGARRRRSRLGGAADDARSSNRQRAVTSWLRERL